MIKNLAASVITLILIGCQNQQYRILCSPEVPRNQCSVSELESPRCSRAKAAVIGCSQYVQYQVQNIQHEDREQKGLHSRSFSQPDAQPLKLGMYGARTGTRYPVAVRNNTLVTYIESIYQVKNLVKERVNLYKVAVGEYTRLVVEGIDASPEEVQKAITDIRALREPLSYAVDMGTPIITFYSSQPTYNFAILANDVVTQTDSQDIYLQAGSDIAIKENARRQADSPLSQARSAVAQFESLRTVVNAPYEDQFEATKKEAAVLAVQARQLEAKDRARQRSLEQSAPRGGWSSGCSCADGNVCYGPRGGRYCITSGGNKRYGI
ncbi:hypothetical protein PS903_01022 [Pseudomonas fluorescens]|nr:hypothetical protein PS903_01022 [Pseudomonas fluorescens]